MRRFRLRLLFLLVLLAGGYWAYGLTRRVDPDSLPARVVETTPELRLAAMRSFGLEQENKAESPAALVEIQHLLISFLDPDGTGSIELATRSRIEAEQLAADLFSQVRAGEDFDDLVIEHTDDSAPGLFVLASSMDLLDPDQALEAILRADFVPAIGDVSWRLAVGEVGVAAYDPEHCPLGWHLIRRIR